jgi:hypothetical protein
MGKKVVKGWVRGNYDLDNTFEFVSQTCRASGNHFKILSVPTVYDKKYTKKSFWGSAWPPKKVKITVEVED